MKTLVLGGARSGKSAYAERLAAESGKAVTYIATAQVYDDGMAARVKEHQSRRPAQWSLVEEPFHLAQAIAEQDAAGHCIVVDCLTLWLAQWICPDCNPPADMAWEDARKALLDLLPQIKGDLILVSNEVGMGIVPLGEINRHFQDEQGRLNQAVAAISDRVVFVAAGLPLVLK